jgi:TRAP-type C4-dicarboxylate transport system permease large subunit
VLQGLTGENIFTIAKYTAPFFVLMCIAVALVTVFPGIATWLPSTMFGP